MIDKKLRVKGSILGVSIHSPVDSVLLMGTIDTSTGQSVDQTKGTVTVSEGHPLFLKCTYQSATYVFWYTQHPGLPPSLLLRLYGTEEVNGFRAKHDSQKKTFHLEKSAIQLRDSAVYFCAASDTVKLYLAGEKPRPRCLGSWAWVCLASGIISTHLLVLGGKCHKWLNEYGRTWM
uniref:Ig-like domain-containing protein n=1 Tax=Varanus komodoensis TaxID=61221 RepID=A0A8D2Q4I7_VARKO